MSFPFRNLIFPSDPQKQKKYILNWNMFQRNRHTVSLQKFGARVLPTVLPCSFPWRRAGVAVRVPITYKGKASQEHTGAAYRFGQRRWGDTRDMAGGLQEKGDFKKAKKIYVCVGGR